MRKSCSPLNVSDITLKTKGLGVFGKKAKNIETDFNDSMTGGERKAAMSLASICSLRMLGLFMILPVFALYAETLEGVTPLMIGLAIGIYGLTQALFQIPFGMLSDRIGRKPVIAMGLLIFALGSVVAAMADSILWVVIGRALQGSGAIAAAIMALTADLTREEHRVKAMAMIGGSIGLSFAFALIMGPVVNSWVGVDGIFWITAVLAIIGIGVLYKIVPTPINSRFHRDTEPVPEQFKTVLSNSELLRLDAGIFILHMVLTATFVVVPFALRDFAHLSVDDHWQVYLPVILIAMLVMVPFIIVAEKRRRIKQIMTGAIVVLAISEFLLMIDHSSSSSIFFALLLFFIAFNVLEASLPSLVAKTSPTHIKGTAMGVYSSAQFLGAFVGGVSGGIVYGAYGLEGVFGLCGVMLLFWAYLAATMRNPKYLGSFMVNVGDVDEAQAKQLVNEMAHVTGVAEVVVIPEDGIAYLKVDVHALDKKALLAFSKENTMSPDTPSDASKDAPVVDEVSDKNNISKI